MCDIKSRRVRRAGAIRALAVAILIPAALFAAPGFYPPTQLTVGFNLEAFTSVKLTEQAPEGGVQVTITSDDPSRLLLAMAPNQTGSKSIVLKLNSLYVETPDFYLQALAGSGTATFTVTAPNFGTAKGTVKFGPAAIVIAGPLNTPSFRTTTGVVAKITASSALLDATGKVVPQAVAGGLTVTANITNSDPKVGRLSSSSLTLSGGEISASTAFTPAGVGSTTLAIMVPAGFTPPPQMAAVTAIVDLPGIGLLGEVTLGKDLQLPATLLLTEPAPAQGLDVTLTSGDPLRLILSKSGEQAGAGSIVLHVPAGGMRVSYFLQGLADSGTVSYTGTAPGYRNRVAPVSLAPSGILLGYSAYGFGSRSFNFPPVIVSISERKPVQLTLWSAFLVPGTLHGEDSTTEKLRPGVTVTVHLKSSNPNVANVSSPVTMTGASDNFLTDFTPLSEGQTVISIVTPAGFATPSNAMSVTAIVKK
jgi:hypothetical protein